MADANDGGRSGKNRRDQRDAEESAAGESSSVDGDDSVNAEALPKGGAVDDGEDPWLEVMQDFARLVIGAFEADPHRFK